MGGGQSSWVSHSEGADGVELGGWEMLLGEVICSPLIEYSVNENWDYFIYEMRHSNFKLLAKVSVIEGLSFQAFNSVLIQ